MRRIIGALPFRDVKGVRRELINGNWDARTSHPGPLPPRALLAIEMQLDYALLADKATLTHDRKLVVVGGDVDSVTVREFPALVQITLVARVLLDRGESPAGHSFGLECVTPDGDSKVVADGIPMTPIAAESDMGEKAARLLIELAIVFSEAGAHTIRLLIDGALAKTFPFRVKHVDDAEAN